MSDKTRKIQSKLIGRKVYINDDVECWGGFWGYIIAWDGNSYHVSGGAIGSEQPIFTRDEFYVPKRKEEL